MIDDQEKDLEKETEMGTKEKDGDEEAKSEKPKKKKRSKKGKTPAKVDALVANNVVLWGLPSQCMSVALSRCGEELGFGFVVNVTKQANMESAWVILKLLLLRYKEAPNKTLVGKENLETTELLYVHFSRLKCMITNSAYDAVQILIEGNEKVPHCKLLLELDTVPVTGAVSWKLGHLKMKKWQNS
ncbi:hypothetical protein ISN44_As11g022080 [Arabidopsis suecica]|uniref:Uncharacterized protein n=1 Tax=Arabidopsis suecica TaxID=45249 RepID=A0A8T1ZAH4_ARASU|nr:hypothetical protein ISN44_As11g022080 [Arabidopsis suecica]